MLPTRGIGSPANRHLSRSSSGHRTAGGSSAPTELQEGKGDAGTFDSPTTLLARAQQVACVANQVDAQHDQVLQPIAEAVPTAHGQTEVTPKRAAGWEDKRGETFRARLTACRIAPAPDLGEKNG